MKPTFLVALAAAATSIFAAGAAPAQKPRASVATPVRLPPATCRIWYRNLPADRQPPPTDCRTARRQAAIIGGEVIPGNREAGGAFRISDWDERYRRDVEARERRDETRDRAERDRDWRDGAINDRDWREDVEPW